MAPEPAPKLTPRVFAFIESRQLGVAWVISVLLGAIVISSNPSVNPQRLLVPVAIMLGYGLFVFNRWSDLFATSSEAYKLSIVGQLADSMYFMGFVWTLWALIDSFVLHELNNSDAIFRTFGYALVTTAVGMFCRLAILQFKYTATEQSQGAQTSVEDVLLRFTSTLNGTRATLLEWHQELTGATEAIKGANHDLVSATNELHQALTTTVTVSHNGIKNMLAAAHEGLERTITDTGRTLHRTIHESISTGLQDFGRQTSTNLDQIKEATAGLATTLKRTNTGLGKSITDLTEKIAATTLGVAAAATGLQESARIFASVPQGMAGTVTQVSHSIVEATRTLSDSFQSTSGTMTTYLTEATATINDAAGKVAYELETIPGHIRRQITLGIEGITVTPHVSLTIDEPAIAEAVVRSIAPVQREIADVKSTTATVANELGQLRSTTGSLGTRVAETASADELRQFASSIQATMITLSARIERLQENVEQLGQQAQRDGDRGILDRILGRHGKDGN